MAIWKDKNGKLHDDMNGEALSLEAWPKDLILATENDLKAISGITEDQIKAILNKDN